MINLRNPQRELSQSLIRQFEEQKLSIQSHVALMEDGVHIPVQFEISEQMELIPSNQMSGGIGRRRVFFVDRGNGISAVHNSWRKGCVMINHAHELYDEFIYVISGKLREAVSGDYIMSSEAAHKLRIGGGTEARQMLSRLHGWYHIPANQHHLLVALENTEFVSKYVSPSRVTGTNH